MKNSKRKLLFTTICISILMILCSIASLSSSVYAAEVTTQQKGLTVLNDVVGLDLAEYATTPKDFAQDSYFDVLPQEKVDYSLVSDGSKLKLLCTFTDGALHIIHVREREGSPLLTKSAANTLEMAKDFLSSYEQYTGEPFYGELKVMLDNVVAGENLTATSGDAKLEVTISDDQATFRWIYTYSGVSCVDKCVVLAYANGFLKYFVDTWDLYKVGNTVLNLFEEEAVAIALEQAKAFSWKVGEGDSAFEVNNFNVTTAKVTRLFFCSSLHADNLRSDDLLMIYPVWRIGVGLDKFYPGNVYGIYVDIWADTKEVKIIQELSTNLDPELIGGQLFEDSMIQDAASLFQSNLGSITWRIFVVFAIVMLGIATIMLSKKKFSFWSCRLPKLRSFRVCRVLLCFLLFSMMLLVPVLRVNAATPLGRATIWGSTAKKSETEVYQQGVTANLLYGYFGATGYSSSNYRGNQTQKEWILANMSGDWPSYPRVTAIYFDHGIGSEYNSTHGGDNQWHYHVIDNDYVGNTTFYDNGNTTFDMDMYLNTTSKQPFFSFITTCLSANLTYNCPEGGGLNEYGRAVGMPFAWTHRNVIPKNTTGFNTAYNMSIDGYSDPDEGDFCYIGFPLGSPMLTQYLDENDAYYYEWLHEFFHNALYNDVTVNTALDDASLEYFNSNFNTTTLHTRFDSLWFNEVWSGCTTAVYGNGNIKLYQPLLAVDTNPELSVQVYVDDQYLGLSGQGFHVTPGSRTVEVTVPSSYEFTNFTWTGGSSTNNPMTLNVSSNINITAYYRELEEYSLTVLAYNQYEQEGFVPLDIDYEYVGTTGYSYDVLEGSHAIEVESPLWDWPYYHVFDYYEYDSTTDYDNPMTLSVTDDMTVTAYYITYPWE